MIYDWSLIASDPAGLPAAAFSDNDDATAYSTTATFSEAGTYTLLATIANPSGLETTSQVTVNVDPVLTSIIVTAPSPTVGVGDSELLTAAGFDQFGNPMDVSAGSVSWTPPAATACPAGYTRPWARRATTR